jgi:tetratricopeptide (TPR) repeat protein
VTIASMQKVGLAAKEYGAHEDAERWFRESLALADANWQTPRKETAVALVNLGFVIKDRGQYVDAQQLFERALKITRKLCGKKHVDTAKALNTLGLVHKDQKHYRQSQRYFTEALSISRTLEDKRDASVVVSLNNLAFLLVDLGANPPRTPPNPRSRAHVADAKGYLERALAIQQQMYPDQHPRLTAALDSLGELQLRRGDHASARQYFERALAIRQKVFGETHPDTARNLYNLARVLVATDTPHELEQARTFLERAAAAFEARADSMTRAASARALLQDVETRIRHRNEWMSESMRGNMG